MTDNYDSFIGHHLKLLLIFIVKKSVFFLKFLCAEITHLSSRLIFTSVQWCELCYWNEVYTPNSTSASTLLPFMGLLYTLCITKCSWLTKMQLYNLNFEKQLIMFVCCDIENSFAPATTKRASEFHNLVNLLYRPSGSPKNSTWKLLILHVFALSSHYPSASPINSTWKLFILHVIASLINII